MGMTAGGTLVILLALLGANLPFVNQRLFGFIPRKQPVKSLWLRLLEMVVAYFVVGALGYLIEKSIGNVFAQGWEFYAVTASLFVVFAFPGFVYRYLWRHRPAAAA
ncbi:transmembrane lipoprotein [Pandoraea iniqua]|uniref:Transmembrane lipoprotein n=2 Tax=Pandoraea iniqua TaxID=2508288 RepID=A0A5E4UVB5_9BURK|nr:transmembrane lipoprotein [Pandoraea iniqua]VVE03901.1 transmembrane lipoprotein [Pandoraea iniqua]